MIHCSTVATATPIITTTHDKVQLNRALLPYLRNCRPTRLREQVPGRGWCGWRFTLRLTRGDVATYRDSELTKAAIDGPYVGLILVICSGITSLWLVLMALKSDTSKVTDFNDTGTKIADSSGLAHWNVSVLVRLDSMFASDYRERLWFKSQAAVEYLLSEFKKNVSFNICPDQYWSSCFWMCGYYGYRWVLLTEIRV